MKLHLRAPLSFAFHQLTKHLYRFHQRFPDVRVELCTGPAALPKGHGEPDLTIRWRSATPVKGGVVERLASTDTILCASPEYLDRQGRPRQPGELCLHQIIAPGGAAARAGALLLHPAAEQGPGEASRPVRVAVGLSACVGANHAGLVYASALSGLGVGVLPSFVAEDALLEGALEQLLPAWRLHRSTVWACGPLHSTITPAAQAMLNFLLETFGGNDRDPWLAPNSAIAPTRMPPWR